MPIKDLLIAAQNGDKVAYRLFLERVLKMISPYLTCRLHSPQDIDDVVQEVLLGIHGSLPNYCADYAVAPWVFSIASRKLNTFLKKMYKNREHVTGSDDTVLLIASPWNLERQSEDSESVSHIREAMDVLKPKQRDVITLLKLQGFSVTEIAERLNISVSDVKVTAHRGYEKIKYYLKRKYGYVL